MLVLKDALRYIFRRLGYSVVRAEQVDAFEAQRMLKSDVESPVIFDVGAHNGSTVEIYRRLIPDSRIYAFEPFGPSCDELRARTQSDRSISVHEVALAEKTGVHQFRVNASSVTNSLLETDASGSKVWGVGVLETTDIIEVDVLTLDGFVQEHAIQKIDILKMDVQGAEHLVLEGARETIHNNAVDIIYTEMITMPTYVNQIPFHESLKKFVDNDFRLYNFYNSSWINGYLRQVDAIFVRRDLADGWLD